MRLSFNFRPGDARVAALAGSMLLAACAATAPDPVVPADGQADLACAMSGNCVNSVAPGGMEPLRYAGTAADGAALLQATLARFPEAAVVRSEPLAVQVIFTTPAGFRDQVDFRIDPQARRIDFRSRSLFGLFDWGKNRSRMEAFSTRFNEQTRR